MTVNLHEHVLSLLLEKGPSGITSEERMVAREHLRDCVACSGKVAAGEIAMEAIRSTAMDVTATRELVRNTQLQVRLYAAERRQHSDRMSPVWLTALGACTWAVGSIPFLWSGFEWIGQSAQLPSFVWQSGAVLSWIAPTALLAAVAAAKRETAFTD